MAHDPTRSWPTGKGPDDTSVPGAAWLELLDGQAFPVVGAGVMVRDGNVWTPASSSNPLHVRAQALEQLIGALNATKETNPDAASASMLALLRGLIAIVGKEATLGQILAALGAPAQESTLVDVLAALTTLAGTIDSGAQKVTLTGQTVEIGGVNYDFDPPRTLYGLAASRPSAAAAHGVVPFARYVSADTKTIEMTDGTTWRRWGVF